MKKILILITLLICYTSSILSQALVRYDGIYDNDTENNIIDLTFFNESYNWDSQSIKAWNFNDIPIKFNLDFRDITFPLKKTYVTSNYGYRKTFRRNHYGIDLKAQVGDTVYAAFDGKIRLARFDKKGYGNYIVVRHAAGVETLYGHLSKLLVNRNEYVKAGEPIGLSGNTGRSTGPHLHFEIRFMGIAINPAHVYDFNNNKIITQNYLFEKHKYIFK